MFERLMEHARRMAARARDAKMQAVEEGLRAELPEGVSCEAGAEGVLVTGRDLKRRYVTDPALRSVLAGAK